MAEEAAANQSGTDTQAAAGAAESTNQSIDTGLANAAAEGTQATPQAEQSKADTFEIKVNGETKQVTKDDLIALAQKGSDYDRVRKGYDYVKGIAEKSGETDVSKYIERQIAEHEKAPVIQLTEEETNKISKKYSDFQKQLIEEGTSKTLAETIANDRMKAEVAETVKRKQAAADKEFAVKKQLADKDKRIQELENQLATGAAKAKIQETNKANAAASTGSVTSDQAKEHDLTEEEFDKLPREEQRKHIKNGDYWKWAPKWPKRN
jgi:hypothetical protein